MAYFSSHYWQELVKMKILEGLWNLIVGAFPWLDYSSQGVIEDVIPIDPTQVGVENEKETISDSYSWFATWLNKEKKKPLVSKETLTVLSNFATEFATERNISSLAANLEVQAVVVQVFNKDTVSIGVLDAAVRNSFAYASMADMLYFLRSLRERSKEVLITSDEKLTDESVAAEAIEIIDLLGKTIAVCIPTSRMGALNDANVVVLALWLIQDFDNSSITDRIRAVDIAVLASRKTIGVNQVKGFLAEHGYASQQKLLTLLENDLLTISTMQIFIQYPEIFSVFSTQDLVDRLRNTRTHERGLMLQRRVSEIRQHRPSPPAAAK